MRCLRGDRPTGPLILVAADEWCSVDYRGLAAVERWDSVDGPRNFGAAISGLWCERYAVMTPWTPEIVEITLGQLTYLFDLAPSQAEDADGKATDRVVGVWGRPTVPAGPRDTARQRGFVPNPPGWSGAGFDRGHYVAHSLGGGMDMNFFPQESRLNRGQSTAGKRWRALERRAAAAADTTLFARPMYTDASWTPRWLDFGIVVDGVIDFDTFDNRPTAA